MKKYFLIPAFLSLAVLCAMADTASAQRGGSRGGSGGRGGGWSGGGSGGRGWNGGGWWGGSGYYGGYRPYYGGYSNYPYSSYYYDTSPSYSFYPPVDYLSPAPVADNSATIRVIVPDPQAQVFLDGARTYSTGTERVYTTPALSGATTFSYQMRATWMQGGQQVTRERTIMVTPGQTTTVDFTRQ